MKYIFIGLMLLSLISASIAQTKRANIWYFAGKSAPDGGPSVPGVGIDFNGSPTLLTNGVMGTGEGSAAIADPNTGKLLFYTNGMYVFDSTHNTMMNGSGLTGNVSSAQSAIIIPQPENDSIYYIFTTVGMNPLGENPTDGYRYSIVNMAANGGLGAVISKNILLLDSATEQQTAVHHCNGRDIWVVTHEWSTNNFYAYLVSPGGITDTVISSIGNIYQGDIALGRAQMKLSPNGKKLAVSSTIINEPIKLYDFDNQTGKISNQINLFSPASFQYGVSFSPDSRKLYVTQVTPGFVVFQFDLCEADISGSRIAIASIGFGFGGGMQLAPDGKIYIARSGEMILSTIDFPNKKGLACGFNANAFSLPGNQSKLSLPDFVQSFLPIDYQKPTFLFDTVCVGTPTTFQDTNCTDLARIWDFGDPAGSSDLSDLLNPTHQYSTFGTFDVKLIYTDSCLHRDSIIQQVVVDEFPVVNLGNDTIICEGSVYVLDAGTSTVFGTDYLWSTGESTQSIAVDSSNDYWVIVNYNNTCPSDTDTIAIVVLPLPIISISQDTQICLGSSIILSASGGDIYSWSPTTNLSNSGIDSPTATPVNNTIYYVTITDTATNCSNTDSIIISVQTIALDIGRDTFICPGETILVNAFDVGFLTYLWSTGAITSNINIIDTGTYWVQVTNTFCQGRDSIQIASCPNIFIPNAFSPNGDGFNDFFKIRGEGIDDIVITVFDRWGNRVFETIDISKSWNGKNSKGIDMGGGVYVYYISGTFLNKKEFEQKGNITLLR